MILATFPDQAGLARAVQVLRAEGVRAIETHTPAPPETAGTRSVIPAVMLIAGILGTIAGFALQAYGQAISYRIDIGGRPDFFWPAYVPFAFETGAGTAVVAGFFAYLIVCRLPLLYDPIDEADSMRDATRDTWLIAVRSADATELARARACLADLAPLLTEERPP
jgi:hypothetical protein